MIDYDMGNFIVNVASMLLLVWIVVLLYQGDLRLMRLEKAAGISEENG